MKFLRIVAALWLACLLAGGAHAAPPQAAPARVLVMLNLPAPHFRGDAAYGGAYRQDAGRGARRRIVEDLARSHGLALVSDWPMPVLGLDCYVLELPPGADPLRIAADLSADKRVEWAQPVATFNTLGATDPLYPVQPGAVQWRLDELHRAATGRKVTVAIVDSGVDQQHPDLDGQLAVARNFVDGSAYAAEPHGTAVAGIIGARAGNGIGIRGVAPGAQLLALRACRETGGQPGARCDSFSLAKALNFAVLQQPQVINLSLTGPPDLLLQRLLDAALGRGIAVVGAADPDIAGGGFPASWPGVFAVGASAAPARDIPTTAPGGGYTMVNGASFATAHVSGLLALADELRPGASLAQLRTLLKPGAPIDACAALRQVSGNCVCTCPPGIVAQRPL